MNTSFCRKVALILLVAASTASSASPLPLSPQDRRPPVPTALGTTLELQNDWNKSARPQANEPDHSLRMIWVRMFPILSVPLGDPYPQTQNVNALLIANKKGLQVFALNSRAALAEGKNIKFNFQTGIMQVDEREMKLEPVWINPVGEVLTRIEWDKGQKLPDGKSSEVRVQVRGGFVIQRSLHNPRILTDDDPDEHPSAPQQLWSAINVLPVNDYLRSVVPSEVYKQWHRETLRTQAIAARTYALYEMTQSRAQRQDYDVDPSTWYQSYQGVIFWDAPSSTWRQVELSGTTAAIKHTRGQVILHGGEVIKSYFSANSGGHTCLVTECFGMSQNPPYIHAVNDHSSVRRQPGGTWGKKAQITPTKVLEVLKVIGITPKQPFEKLEALERGPSGRTWRLRVYFKDQSFIDLDRQQTRKIMKLYGPIRSFLYELLAVAKDGRQGVHGHGYGHGVGMSQWGAQLYAQSGWSAERILEHFYRQVVVKDLIAND